MARIVLWLWANPDTGLLAKVLGLPIHLHQILLTYQIDQAGKAEPPKASFHIDFICYLITVG